MFIPTVNSLLKTLSSTACAAIMFAMPSSAQSASGPAGDMTTDTPNTVEVFGLTMKRAYGPYVRWHDWVGKVENNDVMQFWKGEDEVSGWYALVNAPEDLSVLGSQFKYVRTVATRFQVDCVRQRLRPVERVHTTGPFLEGEVMRRRPINRPWVEIERGLVSAATLAGHPDLRYDAGIFEVMYATTCKRGD